MKFNKTTLAAGLTIAVAMGAASQAVAGIYAGSRLMISDFTIGYLPSSPPLPGTDDPAIGNFSFDTSSTAGLIPGGGDASIAGCSGNVTAGSTTCGAGGAGTPVVYTGTTGTVVGDGPADFNGGRADFDTIALNTAPYLGPVGGTNYASADAIIDSAQLVDAINGTSLGTATRQIAEVEIASADSASANADISSTTSFTYLITLTGEGSIQISFVANPDLLAQMDDNTASDATASANTQASFRITSSDALGGPIDVTWAPDLATAGGCTTNVTGSGVGCVSEVVAETLNGNVTAGGPPPTDTDDISREPGTEGGVALTGPADLGFQNYALTLTGFTAGNYAVSLFSKTAANVTRTQETAIPEPATLLLLGTGLAMCGLTRRRKARKA